MTPVVWFLVMINLAVYLAAIWIKAPVWVDFQNDFLRLWKWGTFALPENSPAPATPFHPFQTLGAAFAHTLPLHIILNMMCLYTFGPSLEERMGSPKFLSLYLFSAVFGGFFAAWFEPTANYAFGASGAICGLLVACAWLFPENKMELLFLPVYIPLRNFTAAFIVITIGLVVYAYLTHSNPGQISHTGHLGGIVGGALFMLLFMKDER